MQKRSIAALKPRKTPAAWSLGDRLLLLVIVVLAFLLRAAQAHSGLPYIHNWDEPQIASHAIKMLKTGDLNPRFFCYGSLLIYLDFIADALNYLRLAGQPLTNPESMLTVDQLALIDSIKAPVDMTYGWYWSISHPSFYLWDRYVKIGRASCRERV